LIVVPHSHPQDWLLVVPAAAILLSVSWTTVARAGVASLLLATFVATNNWQAAQRQMDATGEAIFWVTLTAFGLLVWLTLEALYEARRESGLTTAAPALRLDATAGPP
jgi:hypothetical protein